MTNIKKTITGNKLILEIDLSQDHGKSKSGKTTTVATTNGFSWETVGDDMIGISVNVNKK